MPSTTPIDLSDAFAHDTTKQAQRRAFLKRNRLDPMDLVELVKAIRVRAAQPGSPAGSTCTAPAMCKPLFDFADRDAANAWRAIDDRVMGGISRSTLRHDLSLIHI